MTGVAPARSSAPNDLGKQGRWYVEVALTFLTAGIASLAVVPMMMRLAPRLGLVDQPAARKVHTYPIPRVGGWGIAVGVAAAVLAWVPVDPTVLAYLWSIAVLFLFGAWDDRSELGHYAKFIGQGIAVLPIVVIAGLYVTHFPFIGDDVVPRVAAMAFSVFALIGMTNAINHSDGLDGLAGGESILSLVAIGYLAYQADGLMAVLIAVAVIGGVFGFLRYNTHPAVVFMGDSGSQVIGFSLGVLAILLVERVDPTLSPTVAVLLLGLPVADILYVLYRRIREGGNWFRATKNHVHHRLIERRFTHPEAVVILYGIQIFFVSAGLVFRHASDWLVAAIYLGGCAIVFGSLHAAERFGWYAPLRGEERGKWRWLARGKRKRFVLVELPRRVLEVGVPAYLIAASIAVGAPPRLGGFAAIVLLCVLALHRTVSDDGRSPLRRSIVFCVGALIVYLHLGVDAVRDDTNWIQLGERLFFAVIGIAVVATIRYSPMRRVREFKTTGLDYLIILVVIVIPFAAEPGFRGPAGFLVALLILLYALEVLLTERRERWQGVSVAGAIGLGIIAARSFIG